MISYRMVFNPANSQQRPEDFWLVILPDSSSMEKVMGLSIYSCWFSAASLNPFLTTAFMRMVLTGSALNAWA